MSTITATADNAKAHVRVDLDFSDIDALFAYVLRVDSVTGQATPVRGHGSSTTIAGLPHVPMQAGFKAVLYDTEAPLDQAFHYTASAPAVTANATSTFSAGYTEPWWPITSTVTVGTGMTTSNEAYMAITADGAATPEVRSETMPATAGATFTTTLRVSASVSQAITFGIIFRDAAGAILSATGSIVTVTSAATYTRTQSAPANTVEMQSFIRLNGTPAAGVQLFVYSVTLQNAPGSASSGPATVQSLGGCWLKDPLRPGNNVKVDFCFDPNPQCTPTEGVFFQSMDLEQRGANAVTFNVNNQEFPVVVSKIRSSLASTLTLVSRTFADRDRLNVELAPGSPLLFQVPAEYGVLQQYMAIGATAVSRVLPDHRFPIRVFQLPYTSVAAPGGPMEGTVGARWRDTCNRYASWSAVTAAGLTWTQILQGAAG